ncbi:MAG: type II toxin-antitoxin system VapC family toxin [Gammaproteobacteria bacterium]
MKSYVFDASALVTYLEDRAGARRVERALTEARDGHARVIMCVVNWGEVYTHVWRWRGPQEAERVLAQIDRLPMMLLGADRALSLQAATLRAKYRLPYADCFAAATARQEKARLATSDSDFERVERELRILWLR